MSNNADEITVGANGRVKVADVGTAAAASISEALSASWTELGYINEEGVTFLDGKTVEPIPVWQSFYPPRRIMTEKEASATFGLRQWNAANVQLAFGGGEVVEDAPGEYRYNPPAPGPIDERAMAIEWEDGDKKYRLIIPRGMVSDNVETNIVRTAASDLPIVFGVNGQEGVNPWYLQTDDPAFAPAGSS